MAMRLLVADDDHDAANSLASVLRQAGHTVHVAHDGEAALALAQRVSPDAAVLDIGMPGMDGLAVASHLRASLLPGSRMLIVAVTGRGSAEDKAQARAAGFDHHFTKPVDLNDLLACMARWSDDNGPRFDTKE